MQINNRIEFHFEPFRLTKLTSPMGRTKGTLVNHLGKQSGNSLFNHMVSCLPLHLLWKQYSLVPHILGKEWKSHSLCQALLFNPPSIPETCPKMGYFTDKETETQIK